MKRLAWLAILCAAFISADLVAQNAAATFDGNGTGWVEVPDNVSLVPATGITVEAWIYRSSTNSSNHRSVARKNSASFNESYNLRCTDGQARWILKTSTNGTVQLNTGTTVPTNSWHHLAGTFDNATSRIYLDGAQIGQITGLTGPLLNTGNPLKIGNGDSEPWSGVIDCLRIWSVARTQQQIQSAMNYQIAGVPGLVSSWHLNNNFQDSTGTNHGTMIGTVPFVPGAPLIGFLEAPAYSAIGSPLVFQINNQVPSLPYILDVSITGISPGITIGPGVVVPLNPPLLNYETGASLSNIFVNFFGFLDAAGHATPYVNVPGDPALSGIIVSATYVAINSSGTPSIQFVAPATQTALLGFAPAISGVTPQIGVVSGGTAITIAGSHFQAGATVQIGTTPAANVNVASTSQIMCTTPAGTLGPKSVTVTNPDSATGTLANGFTYVAPLVLSAVTPLVGAPGIAIVVTGTGIQPGASLMVGGAPVAPFSVSAMQIIFTNPTGVPCNTTVQVTNPDGQAASKPFNVSPAILGLFPSSGPAAGANTVSVLGNNFYPGSTVTVNGAAAAATVLGTGSISVVMPPGTPGAVQVVVTSVNGCTGTGTYTYL